MNKKFMVLKGLRVSRGLTQKDMGKIIGKSESAYRKKENGEINFFVHEIRAIGKVINAPLAQIFA